jgi:Uma2 family endonuclease
VSTAPTSAARPITVEEWAELPEDVEGELVDGVLVEEEMPSAIHETVVTWLLVLLSGYFGPRGGFAFASGLKLAVSARRGRLADITCYAPGRRPQARGAVRVPPDVLVEVVSPAPSDERRDRIDKPDEYAAFGVRFYWLVDPELRSFDVWELGADGRYARACSATSGKVERVPGCEGLVVDLDALWTEVDRLLSAEA